MATIKYKGIELQSINECKVFEEPREMLVWNENYQRPIEKLVCAILKKMNSKQFIEIRLLIENEFSRAVTKHPKFADLFTNPQTDWERRA
mgnify:CR=1 FL=1